MGLKRKLPCSEIMVEKFNPHNWFLLIFINVYRTTMKKIFFMMLKSHNIIPMGLKRKLHCSEIMVEKFNPHNLSPIRGDILVRHFLYWFSLIFINVYRTTMIFL